MGQTAKRAECGIGFQREPGETWKTLCLPCWKARKQREDNEAAERNKRALQLASGEAYARGRRDGAALARETISRRLRPDLLKRAAALCHPDRHPRERQTEANAVTAALLELRGWLTGKAGNG